MALEPNDHQAWRDFSVGQYVVELIGLVKQNIPFLQGQTPVSCQRINFTSVHAYQFPEVMAFPGKGEVTHILEIVDGDNPVDGNAVLQNYTFIGHVIFPPALSFSETVLSS